MGSLKVESGTSDGRVGGKIDSRTTVRSLTLKEDYFQKGSAISFGDISWVSCGL